MTGVQTCALPIYKAKAEKENEANSSEPAEAEPEEPANFEETSGDVESGEENEI